jgi:hypothetical protein
MRTILLPFLIRRISDKPGCLPNTVSPIELKLAGEILKIRRAWLYHTWGIWSSTYDAKCTKKLRLMHQARTACQHICIIGDILLKNMKQCDVRHAKRV